jgi:hypothetical protein
MNVIESQIMPASIYPMELLQEMYQLESPEQKETRLKRLADYDASKHITAWQKFDKQQNKNVTIRYYPASWRLFELHLRYPYANFSSDIYLCDREADIVVVKCHLYLGPSYELSPKKAEAYKQGKLSMLDKIETAAKARCARDFGIGTEHALDIEDAEIGDYVPGEEPRQNQQRPSNQRPAPQKTSQTTEAPRQFTKVPETKHDPKTALQLRQELQALELLYVGSDKKEHVIDFNALVEITFKAEAEKGKVNIQKIKEKGDDLPPKYCERLESKLAELAAKKKQDEAA